jgi:hypothetical protein
MSGRTEDERPGYAEIQAASALHPDSGAWAFFRREIIRLPHEMTPAVCQVIRLDRWKVAPDPLEAVRSGALEGHRRAWVKPVFGLSTKVSLPESRRGRSRRWHSIGEALRVASILFSR